AGLVETGAPEMAARAMPLVMPNGLTVASTFALCVGLFLLQLSQERWDGFVRFERWPIGLRVATLAAGFWLLVLLTPTEQTPFLYFQF
ncbi:MAG: hypothetical protein AAF772_07995, partial [Acidobacteriota bacterium]